MPKDKHVALFIPCFIDQLFPETAFSMIKVLKWAGCTVTYNNKQTCCGQIGYNAGFFKEACDVANKFLNDFSDKDYYVVAPSASCIGMLINGYKKLMPGNEAVLELSSRSYEFTEFLTSVLQINEVPMANFPGRAVYHDSCAALRECQIYTGPRQLLKSVKGLELLEMQDNEMCCGFGGTFAVKFEAISTAMASQKIENAMAAGRPQYLISTDSSCLMHLQGYIDHSKFSLKTVHIADVLASGW
jgi:L-lactate dehydrogenase complex protein LldE